ncbi:MAG: MBL fold metallo-hydrolase [Pseudomonadota bacterium]
MKAKLWGVRGSLPAPYPPDYLEKRVRSLLHEFEEFLKANSDKSVDEFLGQTDRYRYQGFGGHTACVEITTNSSQLIIDGGSGLRRLGEKMMLGPSGLGRGQSHVLMTHFHWDHLIGLPFFVPMFIPGNEIHFYAVQEDLEERIRAVFKKPNFPVPYEALPSKIFYHQIPARAPTTVGDIQVTPYELDHPDPCWGLRIESEGRVLSYAVDTECNRLSKKEMGEDAKLYEKANVLIFDAQYSFLEAAEKVNWGHASAPVGLDLAIREGIERVYFVHHDPAASDEKIMKSSEQTAEYFAKPKDTLAKKNESLPNVEWSFAPEGITIDV